LYRALSFESDFIALDCFVALLRAMTGKRLVSFKNRLVKTHFMNFKPDVTVIARNEAIQRNNPIR
jgi:pimeloyl-CoA synthetase